VKEIAGQNLVITKKDFGPEHAVLLFPKVKIDDKEETVLPTYATASKAETYALNWMEKRPTGAEPVIEHHPGGGNKNEQETEACGKSNR
jgi:hypothetical protein